MNTRPLSEWTLKELHDKRREILRMIKLMDSETNPGVQVRSAERVEQLHVRLREIESEVGTRGVT